jgi:hypothetical protein
MSMVLPDVVTPPGNLILESAKSDNTPAFSWSESIYSTGIKGYFVKIDNSLEKSIGNILSWESVEILSDGVHTFYVRAESIDNKTSNFSSLTFTIDTSIIDSDGDGWSDSEEELYGSDPENPQNYPEDTDNDHIPNTVDTDDDNDGYSDDMENSYGTSSVDINSYPTDTDMDGIPNDDSFDNKYTGDEDDDNDGLSDTDEKTLGSSPVKSTDVNRIFITGKQYYLVDASQNDVFDILYNPTNKATTGVEKQNSNYLIDENGDGTWDYIYNIADESILTYSEELLLPTSNLILILLLIALTVIIIAFSYLRNRKRDIEIPSERRRIPKQPKLKKSIDLPVSEKKETVEMITQTKSLLQHIQQDVEVYMEKLKQIEDQFNEPVMRIEKKKRIEKEKNTGKNDIHEIEERIDKILSESDNKENT